MNDRQLILDGLEALAQFHDEQVRKNPDAKWADDSRIIARDARWLQSSIERSTEWKVTT